MKKSLSVILSTAMALSMFSSVAFGKTSADFADLKDLDAATKAKFDAMIEAGIFDGVAEGKFGLTDKMNRAQFAKVAALIFQLEVNKDLKVSSFTDVKADDAANGYALPYIEAVKKAGITDGYGEGIYNPAGEVTKEQLATFLIRGLGKEAEAKATPGVSDKTVSDWAKSYVAYAIASGVVSNTADGTFGGTSAATRELLVIAAHGAKEAYVPPVGDKVSVTKAEATGVKQVTVTFNKAVDTDKAKLALTKGNVAVATDVKFADDKKSAILTLKDVKVTEGSYTVTLSGLDEAVVDKAKAEFKAENEKVVKLSFVDAGDKLPKGVADLKVKIKAENQYGENSSLHGSNYTANVNGTSPLVTRNADSGLLEITVDTTSNDYQSEVTPITVYVYLNQSTVFAQKMYKVGFTQVVSKVELGAVKYSSDSKALSVANDKATIPVKRYDQYGYEVKLPANTNLGGSLLVTPHDFGVLNQDKVGSDIVLTVKADEKVEKSGEYTVTYFESGASATAKIDLKAAKIPHKLEFGTFTGTIAAGDTKDFYIPINAYDAEGNKLTADEIVENASKITIAPPSSATLATGNDVTNGIVKYGENKGKLKISNISNAPNGMVYLQMSIYNANIQTQAQLSIPIQSARIPESVVVTGSEPAKKALNSASTSFKVLVKDQYGETLGSTVSNDDYKVEVTVTGSTYATVTVNDVEYTGTTTINKDSFSTINDKAIKFAAVADTALAGKAKVAVSLKKGSNELSKVERTVEVVNTKDLKFSVAEVKDVFGVAENTISKDETFGSKFGRSLSVTATDKSGDTVALPDAVKNSFINVASSNYNVVDVQNVNGAVKLIGKKAGKATITAVYKKLNGENQDFTFDVNVKADTPAVDKLTAKATVKHTGAASLKVATLLDVKVVDNYGTEYTKDEIAGVANKFFGVQYVISGIKGTGTVSIDNNGNFVIADGVTEFVVRTITANGKSVTTVVTK